MHYSTSCGKTIELEGLVNREAFNHGAEYVDDRLQALTDRFFPAAAAEASQAEHGYRDIKGRAREVAA